MPSYEVWKLEIYQIEADSPEEAERIARETDNGSAVKVEYFTRWERERV